MKLASETLKETIAQKRRADSEDREYKERLAESIEFRKMLDKNFEGKHPQVNFALHTNSDAVKQAYKRMLYVSNSDFTVNNG